jgi:hypothetical protein
MKIGYGINRQVLDFARAPLDLDGFGSARVWVDTDKTVRPEFSEMLMGLRDGDIVFGRSARPSATQARSQAYVADHTRGRRAGGRAQVAQP